MIDPSLISYEEVTMNVVRYMKIYRKYGHIMFELKEDENKALIKLANQFKGIEEEKKGFDKTKWIEENIDLKDVPRKALDVFMFLVAKWHPSAITTNMPSPNEGFIYVVVRYGGAQH